MLLLGVVFVGSHLVKVLTLLLTLPMEQVGLLHHRLQVFSQHVVLELHSMVQLLLLLVQTVIQLLTHQMVSVGHLLLIPYFTLMLPMVLHGTVRTLLLLVKVIILLQSVKMVSVGQQQTKYYPDHKVLSVHVVHVQVPIHQLETQLQLVMVQIQLLTVQMEVFG
mgnify:CR=1 FL=1